LSSSIEVITQLTGHAGVGATDITKLKNAGYWTVMVSSFSSARTSGSLTMTDSLFMLPRERPSTRSRVSATSRSRR
jgi:hypothetical protein